jgi:hypothetical protein
MDQGQEAGPAVALGPAEPQGVVAPPRPAALVKLGRASPQASVTRRNTTAKDPDRRNKVGSIHRTRLASLGSMDPQTSDQPTLSNDQHFTNT